MANEDHLKILKQGVEVWNKWREENFGQPDLREANLSGAKLEKADLSIADLSGADLSEAQLNNSVFSRAVLNDSDLSEANLTMASLIEADFINAKLNGADLTMADLIEADFSGADFSGANIYGARLVRTKLIGADLTGCNIYGISAWGLKIEHAIQKGLIITLPSEPVISIDNLEVAQFVYLLLNNEKIRNVIDTIGEKGVLILGRFTEERKAVLDAIRDRLQQLGFVPMMFDFEKPAKKDFTETIKTLAGLSRFIIADITNPKSSPLELQATMPDYMIPFVPIIQEDEKPFAMFQDLQQKYGEWVLDVLRYDSADNLLKVLDKAVIKPALKKADELLIKKAEGIRDRHVKDYM